MFSGFSQLVGYIGWGLVPRPLLHFNWGMRTIRFLVVFLTLISAAASGDRPDALRKAAERGDAKAQCNLVGSNI